MAGVAIVLGIILILNPVSLVRAIVFAAGAAVIYFGTSSVMQLGHITRLPFAGDQSRGPQHRALRRWTLPAGASRSASGSYSSFWPSAPPMPREAEPCGAQLSVYGSAVPSDDQTLKIFLGAYECLQ